MYLDWKNGIKVAKNVDFFEIMAFKHVAGISLNSDEQISEQQSTCYQTVLGFHIWLKPMFSNSISIGIIKNYGQSAAVLISAVFLTREHVDSPKVF